MRTLLKRCKFQSAEKVKEVTTAVLEKGEGKRLQQCFQQRYTH
jgi:hypothetical protein